ncbi:MAG TPA: response regulator [Chitinophagaceae bacterium]|nr:response regulator [Chitinophagaceae bacterium]
MEYIRIFLADDDADDRFFLKQAFSKAKIPAKLTEVEDGQQLTDLLDGISDPPPPDIIFLDINMPCKNGITCLREIRKSQKYDAIPVVMFSTSLHQKDIQETYDYGASRYIDKTTFFGEQEVMLNKLFSRGWQTSLLNPAKDQYVLKTV